MTTEINIWNGGGWNNYEALRTLKTLPVGTRGLLRKNGVARLDICPTDSERPFGISARYYDADGQEIFHQGFDQNDDAQWIRERVTTLLTEGIQNRIVARRVKLNRESFIKRITAWRRNFDANFDFNYGNARGTKSANKLRGKIGQWREQTGKFSRKDCWNFTHAILKGETTFAAVKARFFGK